MRLSERYADRASFESLVEGMPAEWIEGALAASGTATVRRRRIPADQAVRLVLGMALYRGLSIVEISSRNAKCGGEICSAFSNFRGELNRTTHSTGYL